MKVAILGASDKPDRYSNKALHRLLDHGHEPYPVHPKLQTIDGIAVYPSLDSLPRDIDTLTLYVNPQASSDLAEKIVLLRPRRVIFNPGTENQELETQLQNQGIAAQRACTLVLLGTGQF